MSGSSQFVDVLRRSALAAAIAIVAAAYSNSLAVPFLLDDTAAVLDNPSVQGGLMHLGDILTPPPTATTAGRPLLNLSFAFNYAVSGEAVGSYHIVNLVIHVLGVLALFGVVRRTLSLPSLGARAEERAYPIAWLTAVLWGVHPLQTNAVTYISQRAESLMALCYLVTLYAFIRGATSASSRWRTISIGACACGMATKEVMVTAPVMILMFDRAFLSESWSGTLKARAGYYAGLGASWILLAALMISSRLGVRSVGFSAGIDWLTYAWTEGGVVLRYLKLAFWPHPLVFDYGVEMYESAGFWQTAFVIGLLVATIVIWRRNRPIGFLCFAFFLLLSPTSSVVPVAGQPMAESRMYLPLAPVILLLVVVGWSAMGRKGAIRHGVALALLLVALSHARNCDFGSELRIWEDTIAKHPRTSRGLHCLGGALEKTPTRAHEALDYYRRAVALNPDYADAQSSLASELLKLPGRLDEAVAHFQTAIRLRPDFPVAYFNFAVELMKLPGHESEAIALCREALRLKPTYGEASDALAVALSKVPGREAEALAHAESAVRLKPMYAEAYATLAALVGKLPGREAEAIALYERALSLKPGLAEASHNLGVELSKLPSRRADAIARFEDALRSKPNYPEAHNDLANELARISGREAEAITHYERALQLRPSYAEAHNNLANELAKLPGRLPDALAHYRDALRIRPDFVEAHHNLAIACANSGRLEDAIRELEIVLSLRPDHEEVRANLEKVKAALSRQDGLPRR